MKFKVEGLDNYANFYAEIVETDSEQAARNTFLNKGYFVSYCQKIHPDTIEKKASNLPFDKKIKEALIWLAVASYLVGVVCGFIAALICCR